MQCTRILRTGLAIFVALTGSALLSAADPADDELEAMMEVFDDLSDVGDNLKELPGADAASEGAKPAQYDVFGERIDDAAAESDDDEEASNDEAANVAAQPDDFEHDDIDDADRERGLETENNFEEGEEVDYDEYDEANDL